MTHDNQLDPMEIWNSTTTNEQLTDALSHIKDITIKPSPYPSNNGGQQAYISIDGSGWSVGGYTPLANVTQYIIDIINHMKERPQ